MTDRPTLGRICFVTGLGAAVGMDAVVKTVFEQVSLAQILVWRGLGAVAVLALAVAVLGQARNLVPARWSTVLLRGVVVFVSTTLFFWSLKGLSLSAAYVVTFTLPLVLVILARIWLKEAVAPKIWLFIAIGFGGATFAVGPGSVSGDWRYGLAAFAAMVLYAVSLLMARKLRAEETAEATTAWTLAVIGIAAVAWCAALDVDPAPVDALVPLAAIAVAGALTQYLVIVAFRLARAGTLAPFEYTILPWGVALDLAIWGVAPNLQLGIGCAIVIFAAWMAAHRTEAAT